MEIIEYSRGMRRGEPCVIALGFFDGVHLGHRDLLLAARREADALGISFGIFTFKSSGKIKSGTKRIYTDELKAQIFAELSVDFAVFAEFSELSGLSAEEFVCEVLISDLDARVAVAGYNYRFGKGALADADTLSELMKKSGGEAIIRDEFKLDGKTVSTTVIREALERGDVKLAGKLLGAPYKALGIVSHGRGEGRRLGFPTLNTHPHKLALLPKNGVYKTSVRIAGKTYAALTNVGICPTFDAREAHMETYLLGYSGDVYGKDIAINFLDYIREEKQFASEKELILQINVDINTALSKEKFELEN